MQKAKVFTIDAMSSNSMKSNNPYSGIHETNIAKCLDTMCLDPSCNQGGHFVLIYDGSSVTSPKNWNNPKPGDPCYSLHTDSRNYVVISLEGNGARPSHMGKGFNSDGTMYTLNTIEQHSVCYESAEEKCFITKQLMIASNIVPCLEATDYKEPISICYSMGCKKLKAEEDVTK